jgi:hypothetical protein
MSRSAIGVAALFLVAAMFWVFYPTTIAATHETFEAIPQSRFADIRSAAISLQRKLAKDGIQLNAGDSQSGSMQFDCRGVPVMTLINGPTILSILTYIDADGRAPEVIRFRDEIRTSLTKYTPAHAYPAPIKPGALETWVLKTRDGIDLSLQCNASN